jgi:hypothetical protein
MKTLNIKNHNGNITLKQNRFLDWKTLTAAMVDQALAQSQEDLRKVTGDYSFTLEGDTYNGYEIVARSGSDKWIEGKGKSPRAALQSCHACRVVFTALEN